jgi:hypothetical protein
MAKLEIDDEQLPILIDILSDYLHLFSEDSYHREGTATATTLLEQWGTGVSQQVRAQVARRF